MPGLKQQLSNVTMKSISDNDYRAITIWLEKASIIVSRVSTTRHDDLMAKRMRETASKMKKRNK